MPLYYYHCLDCEHYFEVFHSMKEFITICSVCSKESKLIRVPQLPMSCVVIDDCNKNYKVGEITKKFIEDAKEDLKQQREDLLKKKEKLS